MMGAILDNNSNQNWYHESLNNAASWLKDNNPFFKPYYIFNYYSVMSKVNLYIYIIIIR
jgi:hypothetical protein